MPEKCVRITKWTFKASESDCLFKLGITRLNLVCGPSDIPLNSLFQKKAKKKKKKKSSSGKNRQQFTPGLDIASRRPKVVVVVGVRA